MSGPGLHAVAELRALLFWRRLRRRGGTAEGVATLALFGLSVPVALVFAVALGAASFRASQVGGGGLRVDLPVTALFFGVWQTWTAVALGVAERDAVDLRRYLAYPVRPGRIYALGLASGVLGDPFAAFWLVLLAGAYAGAALGRFGLWLVPLAAVFGAFAAGTVALVALLQELFARLARHRHARELALLAGVLGWALLLASARSSMAVALPVLKRLQWIFFPPALASSAARPLYAGQLAPALPWLALLVGAAALAGWLAFRLALSTALSGGDEGRAAGGPSGVHLPRLLPERLGPVFEKELRYLGRHPVGRVAMLLVPALAGFVAWKLQPGIPADAGELVGALPLFGIAAYVHLVVQAFWLNGFGWDRGGAQALFLAPVDPGAVLAAKNGAVALFSGALFLLAGGVYLSLVGRAPPAWALLGALVLHLGMAPLFQGAGNLLSILNPRAAPFAMQRGGSLPALSSLAGMAIVSGATGIFGLPVLLALRFESPWGLVAAWTVLAVACWIAWWRSLPSAGRLLLRNRDALLAEVTEAPD